MKDGKVDYAVFSEMVDLFMAGGFNYFDTARVYLGGQSETAIRDCLVKRYPRESFVLADKLSSPLFSREEDIVPLFEKQLASCGVGYFDFYLMHAQTRASFEKYRDCRAYETAFGLKRQGRIRHVGISFHDTAEVLDMILTAYPAIEFVQIQFNYVDYDDPTVRSKDVYDVCRRHGKPVIVMEPVKGGSLANLPDDARAVFDRLSGGSAASYAVRYAAGFDGVMTVLSGMSNKEQMKDNLSYMTDFRPLDGNEMKAVDEVRGIVLSKKLIPCTSCRYCTDGCPKHIPVPEFFSCLNSKRVYRDRTADGVYGKLCTDHGVSASDCADCGRCERSCPQHLPIRELLREAAAEFDGK